MDKYRELLERLRGINPQPLTFTSGIITEVTGPTCMVRIGADQWEARLRATALPKEGQLLIIPKVGSAVVLACLSGDYSRMVVIAIDEAERIEMHGEVVMNGGRLGGLVNISELTDKLNELVETFNSHTHILPSGVVAVAGSATAQSNPKPITVPAIATKHNKLHRDDYEDKTIQH